MPKPVPWIALFSLALTVGVASAQPEPPRSVQEIRVIRLDPDFDKLVPPNVFVERIVSGRKWVEGPLWSRNDGYLLFSDVPTNSVLKWQPGKGTSVYLKASGYTGKTPFAGPEPGSNGLAFDHQSRLLLAAHGDRRIARLERNGNRSTLVDRFEGRRINSPNDLIVKSNGDVYFTDPPFGLPRSYDDPHKELPFQGVYRYSPDGKLTLLTKQITAPNGIAFSPDEKKLYISNADRMNAVWMVFDVKSDRSIDNGRILFDATPLAKSKRGGPDGMKIDRQGNIFAAGPGGVYVLAPDGRHLGTIDLDSPAGNVAWGEDGSTLFIASNANIFRMKLTTQGSGLY
jgi:gluconolactonase